MHKQWLLGLRAATALAAFAAAAAHSQPAPRFELALLGLDGTKHVAGVIENNVFAPRVAPDGRRVVFEIIAPSPTSPSGATATLWVAELDDLAARRELPAAFGPLNWAASWTPDGQRLVYLASGERPDALYWRRADGTGDAEHLVDGRSGEGWLPDGSALLFLTLRGDGDYGISLFDTSARTVTVLADLPDSAQHSSQVSRDGRWLAYASNETGRYEVWVEPLPQTGERHRVTPDGGGHPLWSPDGTTLYFARERRMYAVQVATAGGFRAGEPAALPISGFAQGALRRQFDLTPDGRQFVVLLAAPAD